MSSIEALAPGWLAALAGTVGLFAGSFLNVVIHRLPRGESVVAPRSRCPACGRMIRAWENIPVLSFLALRGRCAGCGASISWRYPVVEILTAVLFGAIAWRYGAAAETPLYCALAAALVAAAAIDFDHRIIPDEISLGGLAVALVVVPLLAWRSGDPLADAFARSAAGALLGGGALWLVGFVHARVSVAMKRRFEHWPGADEAPPRPRSLDYWIWFPGVGFGDVKLLAMIGAVLGPLGVFETILVASLAGLAFGLVWAAAVRRLDSPFGFAPAIACGALLVVLMPFPLI
ncbi:MAG: prepilin peptidase [Myxococcota bacterium]|jgi:leader peptidase (prepilin peptidase)/N-methyltransferase|nr:prepilin peptidase [bacterium]MDP6076227.1 prepilin peptidase [Myxococcota bacterium]MDP6244738.1 prepilin peptidase [Myxococcota bacterium]MDP7074933.1 prepilin peptidase [Myxococcota bacterium]MDP7298977.1 prepilin peptidase [Myxococcota bacterium]